MACPAPNNSILPVLKYKNTSNHPWENTIKANYNNRIKRAHNTVKNHVYPEPKENKNNLKDRIRFTVIGIRSSKEFIYCASLVKGMHKYRSKTFDVPVIKGLSTTLWPSALKEMTLTFGHSIFCITTPVIVLKNGEFFGGDQELKEYMERRYIYRLCLDYRKEFMEDFYQFVKSAGRPFAYLDIAINEKPTGLLIFMLYSDIVPRTCENFLRLCKIRKKGYPGSPVHRIVKDGWIQCGGYFLEGSNLECENFIVPHNRRGVLGMCNDGRDVDCSTQFFVLLQPADWMAYKYVAFGQLVEGEEVLKQIEKEPTFYESPTSSIIIERAGILNLECNDITISKRAREYIDKHIEDLIETQEFFWELLMQRLWAEIKARKKIKKEKHKSQKREGDIIPFRGSFRSDLKPIFEDDNENKENKEFAVESYTSLNEMFDYHISDDKMESFTRPFYLPLTDVPYPDEKDSSFNLKRFLQGDYCLESDLDHNLDRHQQHKDVIKIDSLQLTSDMGLFDEDDEESLTLGMSASEEDQIKSFFRQNDRISFAGDVIRTIGIEGKGRALPAIFEGIRRSEVPILSDENLKKLRSTIPQFTDDDLRKLRLASLKERGPHMSPVHMELKNNQQQLDTKRRQTVFAEDLARKSSYQKYFSSRELSSGSIKSIDLDKSELQETSNKSKVTLDESVKTNENSIHRHPAIYVHGGGIPDDDHVDEDDNDDKEDKGRNESTFLKDFEKSFYFDKDAPLPTLKNYRPLSETIPNTKNMFLTMGNVLHAEPDDAKEVLLQRRSEFMNKSDSLLRMPRLSFERKAEAKISSEYVATLLELEKKHTYTPIGRVKRTRQPVITVEDYQKMNQERLEKMKMDE